MRDVRRRERLAGLKRVSRRDSKRLNTPTTDAKIDISTKLPDDDIYQEGSDLNRVDKKVFTEDDEPVSIGPLVTAKRPPSWVSRRGSFSHFSHNPICLPDSFQVDPFFTLPGADEVGHVAGNLLHYSKLLNYPPLIVDEAFGFLSILQLHSLRFLKMIPFTYIEFNEQ